ncbi:hypothetical protein [Planobispora longispora]|nr:hypothetical protein [Planobispora longispora]
MEHMDWDRIPGPDWYLPEAARAAMEALLDWWGCFHPEPGFETYEDPSAGPVGLIEGIMRRVRDATDMLHRVADDPSGGGGHRPGVRLLLARVGEGWSETAG